MEDMGGMVTMQKFLVDVSCDGCKGLFYRSEPNKIVPDADWPRNGEIVVGYEIPHVPGWVRLQNGYYLPMHSEDKSMQFLHKVSTRAQPSNTEMKRIGSNTPLFRGAEQENLASMLGGDISLADGEGGVAVASPPKSESPKAEPLDLRQQESVRAAVHVDAMAFGMGCCCLQITFQAKDIDESRFIFDQLAVMAPM
jgi:hypothetical protein